MKHRGIISGIVLFSMLLVGVSLAQDKPNILVIMGDDIGAPAM
jgi:hypothetical protein